MRIIETPPMPRFKLFFYLILLLIAVLLLVLLKCYGELTSQRFWVMVVGVMLSLFITTITDLIPEIARRAEERAKRGRFKRFFGEAALNRVVRLVFAYRRLNLDSLQGEPWITDYKVPKGMSAEGVNAWLAFQDIRAATYLSNLFHEMTGKGVSLIHDKDIAGGNVGDNFNYCAISIGLGFNGFTHWLSEQCGKKLFEIEFGKSPKDASFETDLIKINGDFPAISENEDFCIVARIVLRPFHGDMNRICFVCAGRTAHGTAIAGFFLAKHWEHLMKLYKKHKKTLDLDSLVVVVRHTHDPFGVHEFETSGYIDSDLTTWQRLKGLDKEIRQ